MVIADDLQPTLKVLEGIVNSAVHPDIAVRAIMVELAPIRKEVKRIKALMDKSHEPLSAAEPPILPPLPPLPTPEVKEC